MYGNKFIVPNYNGAHSPFKHMLVSEREEREKTTTTTKNNCSEAGDRGILIKV